MQKTETRSNLFAFRVHENLFIIRGPSETYMPHQRRTCLIWNRNASSETHWTDMLDQAFRSCFGIQSGMSVSDQACPSLLSLRSDMLVFDGSTIRHVGIWLVIDHACWSLMGLWSGISVFDGPPIMHVGLWWVSDQTYWFPTDLRWVSDRSPMVKIFPWTLDLNSFRPHP